MESVQCFSQNIITYLHRLVQAVEAAEALDRGGGGGGGDGGGGSVLVKVTVVLHKVTVGVPGDLNILQAMVDKESII